MRLACLYLFFAKFSEINFEMLDGIPELEIVSINVYKGNII